MIKARLATAFFVACFFGCGKVEHPDQPSQEIAPCKVPIDRETAISIAKAHLRKLKHTRSEDRVEAEKQMDDDSVWWVTFSSEPPVPGGHTVVKVKVDGTVIDILPGE